MRKGEYLLTSRCFGSHARTCPLLDNVEKAWSVFDRLRRDPVTQNGDSESESPEVAQSAVHKLPFTRL